MKRVMAAVLGLAMFGGAIAGPPQDALRKENQTLMVKLETCAIVVQTIFVKIRAKMAMDPEDDAGKCVSDGKAGIRTSFDALKAAIGAKKAAQELADWRIEWMTAFDAANPQDSDIERAYLQRQAQSKGAISRASNKLEMALD